MKYEARSGLSQSPPYTISSVLESSNLIQLVLLVRDVINSVMQLIEEI